MKKRFGLWFLATVVSILLLLAALLTRESGLSFGSSHWWIAMPGAKITYNGTEYARSHVYRSIAFPGRYVVHVSIADETDSYYVIQPGKRQVGLPFGHNFFLPGLY